MIGFTVRKIGRFVTKPDAVKRDLRAALKSGLRKASFIIRESLREKMSEPGGRDSFWGRTTTTKGLLVRTGGTRARLSPGGRVYESGTTMHTAVGSPDEHVRQIEAGGEVFPGPGYKYLRIPTGAAQTRAGVDRWAGRSIRDIPGSFLFTSKAGELWAAHRKGKREKLERLYLLRKSITTRARHMFARTTRETEPKVVKAIGFDVSVAVARANT